MDIQYLMRQARKLEKAMADAKEKLGEVVVEAESGGGLVKVTMNGRCEVVKLAIDPKAIDPAERAMLEDLVTAAVNAAAAKVRETSKEKMSSVMGGLGGLPGMPGMF